MLHLLQASLLFLKFTSCGNSLVRKNSYNNHVTLNRYPRLNAIHFKFRESFMKRWPRDRNTVSEYVTTIVVVTMVFISAKLSNRRSCLHFVTMPVSVPPVDRISHLRILKGYLFVYEILGWESRRGPVYAPSYAIVRFLPPSTIICIESYIFPVSKWCGRDGWRGLTVTQSIFWL